MHADRTHAAMHVQPLDRGAAEKFLPAGLQPERSGVNARSSQLGLYLGFYNPVTGLLREIGREAKAVAADIARRR
jgi:hypothetical protein